MYIHVLYLPIYFFNVVHLFIWMKACLLSCYLKESSSLCIAKKIWLFESWSVGTDSLENESESLVLQISRSLNAASCTHIPWCIAGSIKIRTCPVKSLEPTWNLQHGLEVCSNYSRFAHHEHASVRDSCWPGAEELGRPYNKARKEVSRDWVLDISNNGLHQWGFGQLGVEILPRFLYYFVTFFSRFIHSGFRTHSVGFQ